MQNAKRKTQNAKRKTQNANAKRKTQCGSKPQYAIRKRNTQTQYAIRNAGQSPNTQYANAIRNSQCGSKPQYAIRIRNTQFAMRVKSPKTQNAKRKTRNATRNTQHAIRNTQYAIRNTQYAIRNKGLRPNMQYAIRNTQYACRWFLVGTPKRNTQYAIRNAAQSGYAICNTQYAIRKPCQTVLRNTQKAASIRNCSKRCVWRTSHLSPPEASSHASSVSARRALRGCDIMTSLYTRFAPCTRHTIVPVVYR